MVNYNNSIEFLFLKQNLVILVIFSRAQKFKKSLQKIEIIKIKLIFHIKLVLSSLCNRKKYFYGEFSRNNIV